MKFNDLRVYKSNGNITNRFSSLHSNNITNTTFIYCSSECVEVNQSDDSVEFVYIETNNNIQTSYHNFISNKKVYKVIAKVIDGVFTYSEKIYGKIVPSQEEYYMFDE